MAESSNGAQGAEGTRLTAAEVYQSIRKDGEEELGREYPSIFWSGIAAGFAIAASVVAETALREMLPATGWGHAVQSLGYTAGFVIVVLGRMQLFTENTITVILPLMAERRLRLLLTTAQVWVVVFVANVIGAFLAAALAYYGYFSADQVESAVALSMSLAHTGWVTMMLQGIPAGFLLASLVWMLPNSRGFELWIVVLTTYIIALGGFTHVIVGSVEISILLLAGKVGVWYAFSGFLVPAFIGNVLGGTALFSVLAYAQVRREIHH